MGFPLKLYSYWRSSASYRVRIALNLKGLVYETEAVDLLKSAQKDSEFSFLNPQQMLPVLQFGDRIMRQSLPIMEWLEEHFEGLGKPLLGQDARERVRVRAIAHMIADDIAPLNVLRVLGYLEQHAGFDAGKKLAWMHHWMHEGFKALETVLDSPSTGDFCEGDEPSLADCCLVPQVYNALRWQLPMQAYPIIHRLYQHAMTQPEFLSAAPEQQTDAVR